ncbi:hypothetical protein E2C01_033416 [Portunus trituberculatus]|uniref:Uncharacterized protein n=1 Tax=Portunus trituberculatus TaxID=210409 RepID=A0A5B7F2W0_PORTR|nr:hypothetical protein [Portunus trituberculatus]
MEVSRMNLSQYIHPQGPLVPRPSVTCHKLVTAVVVMVLLPCGGCCLPSSLDSTSRRLTGMVQARKINYSLLMACK